MRSSLLDLQVLAAQRAEGRLGELSTFFQTTEPVFRLNSDGGIDSALDACTSGERVQLSLSGLRDLLA